MVADPYSGAATLKGVRIDPKTRQLVYTGQVETVPFTADDVAGNRLTFTTTNETGYRPSFDCVIDDITTTEDGADTTRLELQVDGKATGINYMLGGLVASVPQPHITAKPPIAARSLIQLYQRA